jgi:RNA ligase
LNWPGPKTQVFDVRTFEQALELPPRDNAEGIVVLFKDGTRVKIKQADYVALHRLVTGMNDRVVWERLGSGETVDQIKDGLPDEFYPWVDDVADHLFGLADQAIMRVWDEYLNVLHRLPDDFTRKDFAAAVKDSPNRAYLFKYLDNQPIKDIVWRTLKPAAKRTMIDVSEENE